MGANSDGSLPASRSRRAIKRCTRGAGVVAKGFWGEVAIAFSPLRHKRSLRYTQAFTKATRGCARSFRFDWLACAVAVRVVGGVEVKGDYSEAASRSRRAGLMRGASAACPSVAIWVLVAARVIPGQKKWPL